MSGNLISSAPAALAMTSVAVAVKSAAFLSIAPNKSVSLQSLCVRLGVSETVPNNTRCAVLFAAHFTVYLAVCLSKPLK